MESASGDEQRLSAPGDTKSHAGPAPLRLLAVDDNADSAELIARIAGKSGFETRTVTDPVLVSAIVREWKPDIIVSDICMPGLDAIELLGVLRKSDFKGDVVIVSGQEKWIRQQASMLGSSQGLNIVADIEKPVDVRDMRAFLNERQSALSAKTE